MESKAASPGVVRITHLTLATALAVALVMLLVLWLGRGLTLNSSFLVAIITFFFSAIIVGTVLSVLSPILLKTKRGR